MEKEMRDETEIWARWKADSIEDATSAVARLWRIEIAGHRFVHARLSTAHGKIAATVVLRQTDRRWPSISPDELDRLVEMVA